MKNSLLLAVLICSSSFINACGSATQPPPQLATHLFMTAPSVAPVAGSPFNVTVSALDASNRVVSSYSGNVHFTSSDAQAVLPADSKLTGGSGSFSVTFKTSGPQTVTAMDAAGVLTAGNSGSLTVSPGAATQFSVTAPMSATAGTAFNFTVTAQDASRNTTIGYTGNVHFTSSDPHPVLPADSPLTSGTGTKTFSATLNTGGPQTITATDTAVASITGISNAIALPAITVSVAPPTATVTLGTTAPFTATVTNQGTSSNNVTWTVSCPVTACGSVLATTTSSGAPTTYTAPTTATVGNLAVTLTATSVADPTKSGAAIITVPGLTVSIAPSPASVPSGGTQLFTATVNNDPSNGGVNWSLVETFERCSGRFCVPINPPTLCPTLCGTLSAASTASGAPMTYTAPAHFTPPPNTGCGRGGGCTVIFTGIHLRAISVTNSGASGSAGISILPISVSVAPPTVTFTAFSGVQQFTATVTNDGTSKGVSWSLTENGVACSPGCGTVSPANTLSGAPTTYTEPAKAPVSSPVAIRATSVEDPLKSGVASITIPVISVSVTPTSATVVMGNTPQFMATVTNDVTNGGVTWSLKQNGVACPTGCGTFNPVNTASGAPTTYTPPAMLPSVPAITVVASSAADATKSASAALTFTYKTTPTCDAGSGSESMLKGQYAFMLKGFDPQGVAVMAGSFSADGTGKITAGEEDVNRSVIAFNVSLAAAGSSYAVGPDHRGCLFLTDANGLVTYFRFALGAINASNIVTKGHIIEFDDLNGTGVRVAGMLRLQDPTSFQANQFKGSYAVGLVGQWNPRLAAAGTLTSDGVSNITAGSFDFNNSGTITSDDPFLPGTPYTCCSPNGRGTFQIHTAFFSTSGHVAFYMINSSDAFLVNTDHGQYAGEAIGIPSGTTFTPASLTGASVIRETALSSNGPIVDIATASANGTGALTVTDNVNSAGTFTTTTTALNYIVAANGRVTVAGGSTPPVIYLYGPNQGFLVGTDPNVEFGIIESQSAGPFSNASFTGAHTLGTENPSAPTVTLESGVVTSDGSGKAAGTSDQSSPAGLTQNQALNFTYSIPANGTGNVGSNTTAILITGNKLVFINNTSATPTITVVDK